MADADVDLAGLRDGAAEIALGQMVYPGGGCGCSHGKDSTVIRTFDTGATRDTTDGKHEPWGFMSALAEQRFCEYMTKHRMQADGSLRDSNNWKHGIPVPVYAHSLSRHIQDLRLILEGFPGRAVEGDLEEVLCAVLFNVQGMLHETVKHRGNLRTALREMSPGRGGEE